LNSSLVIVSPLELRWHVKPDYHNRPQARALFSLAEKFYDLPVTDITWSPRIVRRLSTLERNYYDNATVGIPNTSEVWLTVSLSEPFNGVCYKLVAGVVILPDSTV
jgi:hypothetical protein